VEVRIGVLSSTRFSCVSCVSVMQCKFYKKLKKGDEMSYKVEVLVAGETEWATNSLRFATREEAEAYGLDLFRRWLAVRKWRVAESDDPVNWTIRNGSLEPLR